MNAFNTRGPSIFSADPVFNGRNTGISQRAMANSIGLGPVPERVVINTDKIKAADKRSRLRKGTI